MKKHRFSSFSVFPVSALLALAMSQSAIAAQAAQTASGPSLNPDLSLSGLFGLTQFNRPDPIVFSGGHDPKLNGFNIQQVELTLGASVDPYFRGDANIVLVPENGEIKTELEEVYGTTLGLPWGLQVKAGTFFTAFGRNNPTHPHTWDFVNKPLILGRTFGGDGLRNPGAQLSWLTPLPWFSELIYSVQNSTGGTAASFRGSSGGAMRSVTDGVQLIRWANFFSLTDDWSANLGASYVDGKNAATASSRTRIVGGDLYLKYRRPDGLSYLALQVEALQRYYQLGAGLQTPQDWGFYSQLTYRLPGNWSRWLAGLRYDYMGQKRAPVYTSGDGTAANDPDSSSRYRLSPVVTFYPSEFSKIRAQYDFDKPESLAKAQQAVTLQFEFNIGAHGAHQF